jgi:hypothetical protein
LDWVSVWSVLGVQTFVVFEEGLAGACLGLA